MDKQQKGLLIGYIIRIFFLILICGLIYITIFYVSNKLLEDKKAKSTIKEGKYILNKMAEEYEKLLRERREGLEKERLVLLEKKDSNLSREERRKIEEQLRKIELERNEVNKEYEKTEKERLEIEKNLKGLEENLSARSEEISRLNQKYLELTLEKDKVEKEKLDIITDKELVEKYWNEYIQSIKAALKEKNKFNPKKIKNIDAGFNNENGKYYIINEFNELYSVISKRDTSNEDYKKEKDQELINLKRLYEQKLKGKDQEIEKVKRQYELKLDDKDDQIKSINLLLENQKKQNEKIMRILNKSEGTAETYFEFFEEYEDIIKKYESMHSSFLKSKKLEKQKKYDKAIEEYNLVLTSFDEVNKTYKNMKNIEKKYQNSYAKRVFTEAMAFKRNREYSEAYNSLSDLIKNAPLSDYTDAALKELLKLAQTEANEDTVNLANNNIKKILRKGESLYLSKQYGEALDVYYTGLMDYPFSDYTNEIVGKIKEVYIELDKIHKEKLNKEISANFDKEYKDFKNYMKKGNVEKARNYYFSALKNAFDIYTNNSIDDFKRVEDTYIETLMKYKEDDIKRRFNITEKIE